MLGQALFVRSMEKTMAGDRDERIRKRAHEIWERGGRPDGAHEEHWLQASREIDAEDQPTASESKTEEPAAKKPRRTKPAKTEDSKAAPSSKTVPSSKAASATRRKKAT
jgi:Protein of unknown function (DUF2934)